MRSDPPPPPPPPPPPTPTPHGNVLHVVLFEAVVEANSVKLERLNAVFQG